MGYGKKNIETKMEMQKHDVRRGVSPRLNEEGDRAEAKISERAPVCVDGCPRPLHDSKRRQLSKQAREASSVRETYCEKTTTVEPSFNNRAR